MSQSPITEVEQISDLAFGFMASKALFAALHLDLFKALAEGPRTAAEAAGDTGIAEPQLQTLLTALAGQGLVIKEGDHYTNAPASQTFLVRGAPNYFGDYLCLQIDRQMYPFMDHLADALRGNRDKLRFKSYASWMDDPDEARLFSESQHGGSLGPGAVLARRVDLSGCRRLLDVGGGTGAFAIMLCQRNPDLSATVLDFPNVTEIGRKFVAEAGLDSRIDFLPGNALESDWPAPQDAVLMSYLFSGVSGEAHGMLVKQAYEVLAPGGSLIVHDFMVEDDRSGPPLAALWALQHLVFTPGAVSITPAFVGGLMSEAGFVDVEVSELVPGMTKVVRARKAGSAGTG